MHRLLHRLSTKKKIFPPNSPLINTFTSMALQSSAFLVNVGNSKKIPLHDDICAVIGRGILPSLTDKRCSRHQAEITFRTETQDALLYVVGPTPVAVQKGGSQKPQLINVNENTTLAHGDQIMLIPDIETKFELQIKGKSSKDDLSDEIENENEPEIESDGGTKRKRLDDDSGDEKNSGGDSSSSSDKPSKKPIKQESKLSKHEDKSTPKSSKSTKSPAHNPFLQNSDSGEDSDTNKKAKAKVVPKKVVEDDDDDDLLNKNFITKGAHQKKQDDGEDDGVANDDDGDGGDEDGPKPLHRMKEGQTATVKGDSGSDHTLKYIGGVYSCSCHAWRNQSLPIGDRTCKHIRAHLGDEFETHRLKRKFAATPVVQGQKIAPPLLLAHKWEPHIDPTGWLISEKLDGVRAYWNGTNFLSRAGNIFHAPDYFTEALPKDVPLDGELWCGRGQFQTTVSIARTGQDTAKQWKKISYQIFDAPGRDAPVEERFQYLHKLIDEMNAPHIKVVKNIECKGIDHLKKELEKVEQFGGEGLMIRKPGSLYVSSRSTTILKVKSFHDDEAIVIDYEPGKGKHKDKVGSLLVEKANGIRFNVGSGLSDAERAAPPPKGSIITFRFMELTDAGVPRFPTFVRIRTDMTKLPKPS